MDTWCRWMDGWTHGIGGWMDTWHRWMDGWTHGIGGWMDGHMV